MSAVAPALRLEGIRRFYREGERVREVLRGVDASVATGEYVVLLGRSGSGKSTLLNIISGIDQPDEGRVWIDGRELSAMPERERTLFRRAHVGFVFQAFNLIPTLSVGENVLLPLELNRRDDAESRDRAMHFLEAVGLADRASTFPDRLSGGEQQRVAIARALAHDPLLILADEPTGNLDARTAATVLDLLERLVRDAGRTLVVVTHEHDGLDRADRLLELREGVLVQTSTAEVAG